VAAGFQVRVNFQTGATTFANGTAIDHWVFTYVSGPTSLPSVTIPAGQQYLNYTAATAGAYQLSGQAQDKNNNVLGSPVLVNFTLVEPQSGAPTFIPVRCKIVGTTGANAFTLRFDGQNLGTAGQVLDHTVVTLTGPVNTSLNLPAGQQTLTFGPAPSMLNGDYSVSLQSVDASSTNIGPPMTGRLYYFDSTQVTQALPVPTTPGIVITNPGYPIAEPAL
jgi:hypothetical protein